MLVGLGSSELLGSFVLSLLETVCLLESTDLERDSPIPRDERVVVCETIVEMTVASKLCVTRAVEMSEGLTGRAIVVVSIASVTFDSSVSV